MRFVDKFGKGSNIELHRESHGSNGSKAEEDTILITSENRFVRFEYDNSSRLRSSELFNSAVGRKARSSQLSGFKISSGIYTLCIAKHARRSREAWQRSEELSDGN